MPTDPVVISRAMSEAIDSGPEISVVVPVRDEADNIAPLIAEIVAALTPVCRFEIVYVDDGSRDATAERLRAARLADPRLRVVRHKQSYGQSQAVASGVKAARGAIIATIDGDGQNDPADIPKLLARFLAGPEATRDAVLIAGRRARRRDSATKRLSSRIANAVRARMLGDNTPDTGCGLKIFTRAAFLDLPRFDHMHRFLPALMIRAGGKVESVAVNHRPRERGQSKYGMWDRLWVGIVDLFGVMWLQSRAVRPVIEPDP